MNIERKLAVKFNAALRFSLMRTLSGLMPYYIINEYPKSGGSWIGEMLAFSLSVPFPRNRLPVFKSSVMHCHTLSPLGLKNLVLVWRDGRDVLVSQYYHYLFFNERDNAPLVERCRRYFNFSDLDDVENNLPIFAEAQFSGRCYPSYNWAEFVDVWAGSGACIHVKYESFLNDTALEILNLAHGLGVLSVNGELAGVVADRFSFSSMTGRKPGDSIKNSFLRKGVSGDWKNHFSNEMRVLFSSYAGKQLIDLGYEDSYDWVRSA